MKNFINEFKKFALKGNVIDLAVAVVIGAAFGKIVTSLVDDIIMPVMGAVVGGVDLTGLSLAVGDVSIAYGNFLQTILDFTIIAFCIFLLLKAMHILQRKHEEEKAKEEKITKEIALLQEIRDLLKK